MRHISTLLLATGLWLSVGFGPPPQSNQPIQLSVEAGFDGYYRESAWVPVFVSASNDGPDISGELRVRTQGGLQNPGGTLFATPIELPNQSRKQVTMFVTLDTYDQVVQVELLHRDLLVARAGSVVSPVQPPDVLYAVVSDSTTGVTNLDTVRPFIGEAFQANLAIERLPAQPQALSALDALLISDADTGRLTVQQRQALADWVLSGGHLIVSGGAAWQRTSVGLTDLLPVEIDSTITVEGLDALEAYLGRRGDLRSSPTIVTTGKLKAGTQVLLALPEADVPLLVRGRHGQGVIDYLAADPAAEPLASWPNTSGLWTTLLTSVDQRPAWWSGFGTGQNSWSGAQDATEIIPFTLPASAQILGFLLIYVILIGPLNYLVLKRLGRRELGWVIIPSLILTFSVIAYLTGFGLRGTHAIVNRLSVVRAWPDTDRAQVDSLIGLWSPFRTTYTVAVPEGYTLQPIPVGSGLGGISNAKIEQGAHYTARDVPVNIGSVRSFVTQGFSDNAPSLDAEATLSLPSAAGEAPIIIRGSVTNTNDFALADAVVLARGASMPVGTLEAGASKSFLQTLPADDEANPASAAPVALGLDFRYDLGSFSYYNYRTTESITVTDILNMPADFRYQPITTPRDRELRRRYLLLGALAHELDPGGGRGNNVYLAAWADRASIEVTVKGAEYSTVDSTLYLFQIPVTISAPETAVVIGPDQMSWMLSEASTRRDLTPFSRGPYTMVRSAITLNPDDRVGFRFTPLPDVRPSRVTGLVLNLEQITGTILPGVALWDWAAGDWVVIPVQWDQTEIQDPARFVGPEGAVEVLLYNALDIASVSLSRVDVMLVGVL